MRHPVRIDAEYPNGNVDTSGAGSMQAARRRAMIYTGQGVNVTLTPSDYKLKQEKYPAMKDIITPIPPPRIQIEDLPPEVSPTLGNALDRINAEAKTGTITVEIKADASPMLESIRKIREETAKASEELEKIDALERRSEEHWQTFVEWSAYSFWLLCLVAGCYVGAHWYAIWNWF